MTFQRSELFEPARQIFSHKSPVEVTQTNAEPWLLRQLGKEEDPFRLGLFQGERRIFLPDYSSLSPDKDTRIRALDRAATAYNLPRGSKEEWHSILVSRSLDDDEAEALLADYRDTPTCVANSIRHGVKLGHSSPASLVPISRRYFDRLIGVCDGASCIREYAAGGGKQHLDELIAWQPHDGFLLSLLLSSHSSLTKQIDACALESADLAGAFERLIAEGDTLSQLGASEIGLRALPSRPELYPLLVRLIRGIRDAGKSFQFVSGLFILVDAQLSKSRLFSEEPPFYRRLASMAQAALVHR